MKTEISLAERLAKVLVPTRLQILLAFVLAVVIVLIDNLSAAVKLTGVDPVAIQAFIDQYQLHSTGLLTTKMASYTALITFWATVGMIAYLICWSTYNVMIEARNELTLKTQYTNRGHRRGSYEAIGLKALSAVLLILSLMALRPGFSLWLSLAAPAFTAPSLAAAASAAGAVVGLAAQLYLVFAAILMTFTPWYRKEAFTLR